MRCIPGNYAPEQESYPLDPGEIVPTNRISAYKQLWSTPWDYPHCLTCHRAMLAIGPDRFTCPNGHMTLDFTPPTVSWWRRIWRLIVPHRQQAPTIE